MHAAFMNALHQRCAYLIVAETCAIVSKLKFRSANVMSPANTANEIRAKTADGHEKQMPEF